MVGYLVITHQNLVKYEHSYRCKPERDQGHQENLSEIWQFVLIASIQFLFGRTGQVV